MRSTTVSLLLAFWSPALVAQAPAAPPAFAAVPAAGAIVLDGAVDEPAWTEASTIPGLTQQDPEPGKPTPFDATRVSVISAGDTLYFGIVCPDPQPESVAVHTLQRDSDMEGDDTVALVLDTFGDGRTGYLFRVNAGGARQDGLISGPEETSLDWDGIWDARTQRTAGGWSAEIAISARSLRFRPGLQTWGNWQRTLDPGYRLGLDSDQVVVKLRWTTLW